MDPAFATAVLARLHVGSGRLSWMSCGHPEPIIVRRIACLLTHTGNKLSDDATMLYLRWNGAGHSGHGSN